jgi:PTH2 family peptidyl-tRNA hydrolase
MGSKQVLVMKKFPKDRNMRTGKYVAQGAHASVGALFSAGSISKDGKSFVIPLHNPFIHAWVTGNFKKVALYVESDEALVEIYNQARKAGLPTALIRDAGLTEFKGEPTLTAVGIGPEDEVMINEITGHLPLF